jgi:transcriptional regulator with XRE-family HTH domain
VDSEWSNLLEIKDLGANLAVARLDRGFSQARLAEECGLSQTQISLFEAGRRLPSLDQFVRLARALDVPFQRLLTGSDRPGSELGELAVELRRMGAVDLWVADATVPGAGRRPEEVVALAASGISPDPRVIESLPALLSWNRLSPSLLRAHGIVTRTTYRLAWLADVALLIDRQKGFPGGCFREPLLRFLKAVVPPKEGAWDALGRPEDSPPKYPAWKRWRINFPSSPARFEERARELYGYRQVQRKNSNRKSLFQFKISRRSGGGFKVEKVVKVRPEGPGDKDSAAESEIRPGAGAPDPPEE